MESQGTMPGGSTVHAVAARCSGGQGTMTSGVCPNREPSPPLGTPMLSVPALSGYIKVLQRKARSLLLCKLPEQ